MLITGVPVELCDSFKEACVAEGQTVSGKVKYLMSEYLRRDWGRRK